MAQLADTHVHLLGGLDDGPRSVDEAVAMCRQLVAEGARHATALAHQNEVYPDNTAARLRAAALDLSTLLRDEGVPLQVHVAGEVALSSETGADWRAGRLVSFGDHARHLLVEMPSGLYLDIRGLARELGAGGPRLVVAHAERCLELLHEPGLVEGLISAGCLIQVTAGALAAPPSAAHERALKDWARRGVIHLLGSDGHRIDRRAPRLRAGFEVLAKWVGRAAADRIACVQGAAALQGLPLHPPPPAPRTRSWFSRLLGA